MKTMTKLLCCLLAVIMLLALCGCGENEGEQVDNTEAKAKYVGTWQGSDHDGENVVHYLIFDNEGYWNVYMNITTLTRAIKQLPDQLVSFKTFREVQNSDHTGCFFEYVKDADGVDYTECFSIDEEGQLTKNEETDVYFTKFSTHTGEPDETMIGEARDLFDRARESALS